MWDDLATPESSQTFTNRCVFTATFCRGNDVPVGGWNHGKEGSVNGGRLNKAYGFYLSQMYAHSKRMFRDALSENF